MRVASSGASNAGSIITTPRRSLGGTYATSAVHPSITTALTRSSRATLCMSAGEIVASCAGMGVDDAERGRLCAQMNENAGEDRMLDDVGEIAGVKGMTIVHC